MMSAGDKFTIAMLIATPLLVYWVSFMIGAEIPFFGYIVSEGIAFIVCRVVSPLVNAMTESDER